MKDYEISSQYVYDNLRRGLEHDRECFDYFISEMLKLFPNETFKCSFDTIRPKSIRANSEIYKSQDFPSIIKYVLSDYTWCKPFTSHHGCNSIFTEVCWQCALEIVTNCQWDTINLRDDFVVKVVR